MPDLTMTDEKILGKYGSGLTANFADIRAYGAKAFFQRKNASDNIIYSLCVCATGYIWIYISPLFPGFDSDDFSDIQIQMGTFALKASTITTTEIQFQHKNVDEGVHSQEPQDGRLAFLCATAMAKYLRLRMMGKQYEEATESAIKETCSESVSSLRLAHPTYPACLNLLLREVCANAPMPPESDVSMISRSMITRRWQYWRETSVLRKRYFFPKRIIRCFRTSRHDSTDLLSGCFNSLKPDKSTARE